LRVGRDPEVGRVGDVHNALLMLTYDMDFGAGNEAEFGPGAWKGKVTLPVARLYRIDDNNQIKTEHTIYYVAQH
jgi:hypothetical protein